MTVPTPQVPKPQAARSAELMMKRLEEAIRAFESELRVDEQVGLQSPGFACAARLDQISYRNPDLLIFSGVDNDGRPVHILQHPAQVNLVLVADKVGPGKRREIGFRKLADH